MAAESVAKDLGLELLKLAIEKAPEIARLLDRGLDAEPDHPLAPQVRELLPVRSASRAALEQLDELPETSPSPGTPPKGAP
jgi:hypothetical protein